MDQWVVGIFTLAGVIIGAFATYVTQLHIYRSEQRERAQAHLRTAYADWIRDLKREVVALRTCISYYSTQARDQRGHTEGIQLHFAESGRELSLGTIEAAQNEDAAFAKVLLLDNDKVRLDRAQEVREEVKTFQWKMEEIALVADRFAGIEATFLLRLSKFIAEIRPSLA